MNTKRIKIGLVFVYCCSFFTSFSQESRFSSGLFSGVSSIPVLTKNIWVVQSNPAVLSFVEKQGIGLAYSSNYNITNSLCSRINAGTKVNSISYGLSFVLFGNSHLRESYYEFCIARKINENNALGLKFNYKRLYQEEYKTKHYIYPELAYYGEKDKISYGINIVNPFLLFKKNNSTSALFTMNFNYKVNKFIGLGALVSQSTDYQTLLSLSTIFAITNNLQFGITCQNDENPFSLIIKLPFKHFVCDYETSCNFYLGFSHTISFIFIL